jgi:cytochrome c-type biogenesis protein CcmH/NrfG
MGFLEEANRQLAQGDLRAAKGALLRAHALAPESPQVLLALGNLCLTGGWHAEGAEAYTKLLRRDPAKVEVLLALGKCAFEAGDPASARDAYERVRALDPGNSLAAENLAVIHSGAWQGTGPERTP